MRLDKFLKVSRVIKRRTVANEACDNGRVSVNGKTAKAGTAVKPGDIVQVEFAGGSTRFEILSVEENVKKSGAAQMYRLITSLLLAFFIGLGGLSGCQKNQTEPEEAAFMEAGESYIALVGTRTIYDEQFCYFFSMAAQELSDGQYSELWLGENFDRVMDRAIGICREVAAMYDMGYAAGLTMTALDQEELSASVNERIVSNLALAQNEDINSWDEICIRLTGMNHKEYKRYLRMLQPGEKYAEQLLAAYNPSGEEQEVFYQTHLEQFKTCRAGEIYIPAENSQGESNQGLAEEVLNMVKQQTYPFEVLARGWSEDSDVLADNGFSDLCVSDEALPQCLKEWIQAHGSSHSTEEPTMRFAEDDGYYILICQGERDYETSQVIQEAVLKAMKEKMLSDYKAEIASREEYEPRSFDRTRAVLLVKEFLEGREQ